MPDDQRWSRPHPDLWTFRVDLAVLAAEAGRRGVAVRYAPGRWAFVGPVPLPPDARAELDREGVVDTLIQATAFHNTFVPESLAAFPEATLYAAAGSRAARGAAERVLRLPDDLPAEVAAALVPVPIEGMRAGHEVAFVHPPSATAILADLCMHFPDRAPSFWTAVFRRLAGWVPGPRMSSLFRLLLRDRAAAAASIERLLEHPIERIVPAHGAPVESGAREALVALRDGLG